MTEQHQARPPVGDDRHRLAPHQEHARRTRVLKGGQSAITRGIAHAIVIKDENLFFLAEPSGDVPLGGEHGLGLYYHDCRYLNGYELRLAGAAPDMLSANAGQGAQAVFELTNPDLQLPDGTTLQKEELGITWTRVVDSAAPALLDVIRFQNFDPGAVAFPLTLTFAAAFEDIFVVRGAVPKEQGRIYPPVWRDGALWFLYDGADGVRRRLMVQCDPAPARVDESALQFDITLESRAHCEVVVALRLLEATDPATAAVPPPAVPAVGRVQAALEAEATQWLAGQTEVESDSLLLNNVLDRSLRDLRVLRSTLAGDAYFAAGLPWFGTLFGRDSLITALQMLAYNPAIAEQTLRVLARYQGTRIDEWRDEQPGKILHELRVGEMAHLHEIPHTPYYGTVDATPLFLVLVGRHAAWTGDLRLFHDLRDHIERALTWVDRYGDLTGAGYVSYAGRSDAGLTNQGWKDSGAAIMNADGTPARPPIALVEVQGYVYLAKTGLAELYARAGDAARAEQLRREAIDLRARFNRDFWLADQDCYALALQAGGAPAAVVSSNPGQALWTGICDDDKAQQTVARLMADDMFSGWGVRTLATGAARYNPIGYHLGTVWPHDNSLIAAGFRRYGADEAACRIFTGIVEAAMYFESYRLPELFAGFARGPHSVPVRYPVACHPQAWAAGSVPLLLATLLGLEPDAFARRLRIVRPMLPDFIDRLHVRGLRVGAARADLAFTRADGRLAVDVQVDGDLDVVVEPGDE
ncbi:MAG TPA: glycogen debranching N-terminal domain-containing protein [Chloroflexia bacterium]|nr:glycogen debranching N-terminal domain-containing protein [Chloroflexia bacterium]